MSEPDSRYLPSFDGTMLAASMLPGAPATPVLFVDAIGTRTTVFHPLIETLSGTRPILNWDLRGLFDSGPPGSGGIEAGAHSRDAIEVLDAFGIDRCAVVTWSSGGRIALELAAANPDRIAALVLVCSGYGQAMGRLIKGELSVLLPKVAGVLKHLAPLFQNRFRNLVARPEIAGLVRQSGMTGATADTGALVALIRSVAECDPRTLLGMYEAVSGDPASVLLPKIEAPTLVAAAEFDQFTSREVTRELVARIPDPTLEVFDDATHFLPIEYPEELTDAIVRFLDRIDRQDITP